MVTRLNLSVVATAFCLASLGCSGGLGCGSGCGAGCNYAGMKYDCACEETCGPCCGGGPKCGCGNPCQCGAKCGEDCSCQQAPCRTLLDKLCGCTGCGELYWSEWHNDPPACCEPCDCLGHYTGPGAAGHYQRTYPGSFDYAKRLPTELGGMTVAEEYNDAAVAP